MGAEPLLNDAVVRLSLCRTSSRSSFVCAAIFKSLKEQGEVREFQCHNGEPWLCTDEEPCNDAPFLVQVKHIIVVVVRENSQRNQSLRYQCMLTSSSSSSSDNPPLFDAHSTTRT